MSKVLVTGATGQVARGVLGELEKHFELRLLAIDRPDADPRRIQADVLDLPALEKALRGVDAVLHLAVAGGHSGTYEDDAFNDVRFDINVKGAFHVFEAARRAGVRRIVHVSSLMVVWGHARKATYGNELIPGNAPPAPVGTYALTKALGEQIARYYSEFLEVVTIRIAAPVEPAGAGKVRPQQVPYADLAQAFCKALTAPLPKYEVVTIVGDSSRRCWDLESARRVLGHEPTCRLDDFGVEFDDPFRVTAE